MPFTSVAIFVLAAHETDLLRETINGILENIPCETDLDRIVIVLKSAQCPSRYEAERIIESSRNPKITTYIQKSDSLAACIAELPALVNGSHFLIMAGDMEMDPRSIRDFIRLSREKPERIVCAAKWMHGSTVEGYGALKYLGTKVINSFACLVIGRKVYDPFSFYEIYPMEVYRKMQFDNPDLFPFEMTLKPLLYGEPYKEIPTVYRKRESGRSNFFLPQLLRFGATFCKTAVRLKLSKQRKR